MKTRIRVQEYNNGKKSYVCEAKLRLDDLDGKNKVGFITKFLAFLFLKTVKEDWVGMKMRNESYGNAVFSTESEAKEFLDELAYQKKREAELAHQWAVKSNEIINYNPEI